MSGYRHSFKYQSLLIYINNTVSGNTVSSFEVNPVISADVEANIAGMANIGDTDTKNHRCLSIR